MIKLLPAPLLLLLFTLELTCNSLLLNLPATQTNRLQLVLNSSTGSLPTAVANANECIRLQRKLRRQHVHRVIVYVIVLTPDNK